ncbi:hypothetical protein EV651_111159 [Kribbella sp. VKM Ac-2571]|uniref:hypothetical protein n=1 Tax=Kribbella sp. VKM Ac-2571 TaxID=2512222 RepID=UPI00105D14D7|nr:hypothetical protein [Kribbella sp. VKM Ac-2571]TDO57433.1 hypothetical protein EV651_111159 [Kribbella sp. VKM Ac-2571]
MGYWGYLVAAKSDLPLDALPTSSTFGDEYVRVEPIGDGWQLAWVAGTTDNPLTGSQALARTTGHPVLAALIVDSDCGPVAAADPQGSTWSGTLAKSRAIDSYHMPDDGISPSAAVASFRSWSEAAALPLDESLAIQALTPDATDPEHLFGLLLQATAIAPSQP